MKTRIAFGFFFLMFVLVLPAIADSKGELQKYFNNTANKIKATVNPTEKRAILNESFQSMNKALDIVKSSPLVSKEDGVGIDQMKAKLQDKQDQLEGNNGYTRVSDLQLNQFSNYVVQDMEQADPIISISLVTLLLIILLVVLIVK